ncbi:MAG: hypothetical protein ABFD79_11845 [Phycisphaerales bacterium]
METARIIKGSDIKLDGTFRLDAGASQSSSVQPVQRQASSSVPVQARIVESQPQYAIIEVTCSCGTKTHVRCEF